MARASTLHPFSRRVALWFGGVAVVAGVAALYWARTRIPPPEEVIRRVRVEVGAPGEAAVAAGGTLPADRPVEVRFQHDLPRPVGLAVLAHGPGGTVWLVPPAGDQPPLQVGSTAGARVVPALPSGSWAVISLVGWRPGTAAEWLAAWQRNPAEVVGRTLPVEVR